MAKKLKLARHYETTNLKIGKIREKYNLSTPQIVEALIENIGSLDEMDALFGYKPRKRRQ